MSRLSRSFSRPVSSAARSMNRRRSPSRVMSMLSRWKSSPYRRRTATLSTSRLLFFSRPPTRYSREPSVRTWYSPWRVSAGGSRWGTGFTERSPTGMSALCSAGLAGMSVSLSGVAEGGSPLAAVLSAAEDSSSAAGARGARGGSAGGMSSVPRIHSAASTATRRVFTAGAASPSRKATEAWCCAYPLASMPQGNLTRKHSMPRAVRSSASLAAARFPASSAR